MRRLGPAWRAATFAATCEICGAAYMAKTPQGRTCGDECQDERKRRNQRARDRMAAARRQVTA